MLIDINNIYFGAKYDIDNDGNINNISFNTLMENDAPDLNAHIYKKEYLDEKTKDNNNFIIMKNNIPNLNNRIYNIKNINMDNIHNSIEYLGENPNYTEPIIKLMKVMKGS